VAAVNAAFEELQHLKVPLRDRPNRQKNNPLLMIRCDPFIVEGSLNGALHKPGLGLIPLNVMRYISGGRCKTWDAATTFARRQAEEGLAFTRPVSWNRARSQAHAYFEVKLKKKNLTSSLSKVLAHGFNDQLHDLPKTTAPWSPIPSPSTSWTKNTLG
jgi:hypothetical protein